MEKQLRGHQVVVACTSKQSQQWSKPVTWPTSATRVLIHPNGTVKECRLLVQGRVSVSATF